jgi:asparagine N-glycosylation enzyme membrane subunit Stt3
MAFAVWQVPGLDTTWPVLALVGAGLSTALLVLFWNGRLVLGLVINALLIAAAVLKPAWLERFMIGGW